MKHILQKLLLIAFLYFTLHASAQDNYKLVIDYQFDNARYFENGLAPVNKGDKYGYIDQTGNVVIDYQFENASSFKNGLAYVKKGSKWGYIDQSGKVVIDYQFDNAGFFENGLADVRNEGRFGYIDQMGKVIIGYQFEDALPFSSNGLAPVQKGMKFGYIDKTGKMIIKTQFSLALPFDSNGLAIVRKEDKWGYINQTGEVVIDYQFDGNLSFSSNGLAAVKKGNKWGFIDQTLNVIIDYQFDYAFSFSSNGLAAVKKGDKFGYIDQAGNVVVDYQFDNASPFSSNGLAAVKEGVKWGYIILYNPISDITDYINTEILKWQKKGKYETTEAYQARVTESNRKKKLEELSNIAVQTIAQEQCDWKTVTTEYDADNQTFKVNTKGIPSFYVKVPVSEAESFDKSISNIQFQDVQYALGNDKKFFLQKAIIKNPENGKEYSYSSDDNAVFAYTQLNMNFEPLNNLTVKTTDNTQTVKTDTKSVTVGLSEVDINIPANPQTNEKTFVVIIANENYQKEVKVQYALNDGKVFNDYCEKTLGIPAKNIHFVKDASFGNMKSEIKWISDVMAAFNGQAKVIFYYAGHGMPNESDKSAYLLPVDGFSSDFETAIKLDDLYGRLTINPSQSVTVFLDACFSGSVRENGMLANARGVKIKPKAGVLKGNMVVFSAATGDETAYPYKEKQHGLFTYFLLKKLQDTKGEVDYQTLSKYITENVKQQSIVVNQKSQTPQVNTSLDIQNLWMTMKIK